jgi:outer membrane protein TolC
MKPAPLAAATLLLTFPAFAQTPTPRTLPPETGEARLRSFLVGSGGLTSDEVVRRAVATSREVAARRASAAAAKAKEDQTTAGFWPRLSGSARYTRMSPLDPIFLPGGIVPRDEADRRPGDLRPGAVLIVTPPFPSPIFENNYALVGTLSVPVSDYLLRWSRASSAAEHSTRAAQSEEEAARRKVAADARIAYYDWIRARGQVIVIEDRMRAAGEQVKDARRLFDAGFASRADVLRAESQEKTLALALTRARHTSALAEEALRVAMHDDSGKPYQIGEDLLAPVSAVPGVDDPAALHEEAKIKRPEMTALLEADKGLLDAEALTKTGRYPRLDLQGNVQYANPNPRVFPPRQKWDTTWDASVVLSWTPTEIPLDNAHRREQAARRAEVIARREALLDALRLEVARSRSDIFESDANIDTTKQGLAAATEGYRVRRELFLAGKATMLEVIDAEADLTRARLEVLNALVEARIARVRFDYAVGRDGG